MQILKSNVHFGVTAVFAADLELDTIVKVTAAKTVNVKDATGIAVGVVTAKRNPKNNGTIDVFFKHHAKVKIATGVSPGDAFKWAAVDGTTGENRIAPWVSGTDGAESFAGVVFVGGAANATAEVFIK